MLLGFYLVQGIADTLNTLCSQLVGSIESRKRRRNRDKKTKTTRDSNETAQAEADVNRSFMVGIILQRSILITLIASVPIIVLWCLSKPIMITILRQDERVATLASRYLQYFVFGAVPYFCWESIKVYLLVLDENLAPLLVSTVTFMLNLIGHALLCTNDRMGMDGSAISMAVSHAVAPLAALLYIYVTKCHVKTWNGFSRDALSGWKLHLKKMLPGLSMICLEGWVLELGGFAAGSFGSTEMSAYTIALTVSDFMQMVVVGMSSAVSRRVGQFLGAAQARYARATAITAIIIATSSVVINSILIYLLRYYFGYIFSYTHSKNNSGGEIAARTAQLMIVVAGFQVFDGTQKVCAGILRGAGQQKFGAITVAISYYLLGVPLAAFLAFGIGNNSRFGALGICYGILAALGVISFVLIIRVIKGINWRAEVVKVSQQLAENEASTPELHNSIKASASMGDMNSGSLRRQPHIKSTRSRMPLSQSNLRIVTSNVAAEDVAVPAESLEKRPAKPIPSPELSSSSSRYQMKPNATDLDCLSSPRQQLSPTTTTEELERTLSDSMPQRSRHQSSVKKSMESFKPLPDSSIRIQAELHRGESSIKKSDTKKSAEPYKPASDSASRSQAELHRSAGSFRGGSDSNK